MCPYKLCGGRLHSGQIQRRPDPVAGVKQKGVIHPRVQQVVVVGLGVGCVPRMKAVRHRLDVHRAYIRRQMGIERRDKLLHRHLASIAEAERETPRMDARIRAGAALYIGPLAQHGLHGILQNGADCRRVGLHLKACVVCTLVGDPK